MLSLIHISPALAAASYPFVDLPSGDTLRCKLFQAYKFHKICYLFDSQLSIMKMTTNRKLTRSFDSVKKIFLKIVIGVGYFPLEHFLSRR